jgi:hypothetical protein
MLDFNFDSTGWEQLENEAKGTPDKVNKAVKFVLRKTAFWGKRKVQRQMPVDSGAARASWGAEGEAGIWYFMNNDTTHVQGSRLPYIQRLNEGHSKQAPAGFIDVIEEQMIELFIDDMAREMLEILG